MKGVHTITIENSWQSRLQREEIDLAEKITNLSAFLDTEDFQHLKVGLRDIIQHQLLYMIRYQDMLKARIRMCLL